MTDPRLTGLLERMVAVDSRLPTEARLGAVIADEIRQAGFEPEIFEVAEGRPNVCCSARIGPGHRLVTLTGHMDTVGVAAGWTTDPFAPTTVDQRLYGLGAADMKAGLACAWRAFLRLVEVGPGRSGVGRVGFAATVDEEAFGTGARALLSTEYGRSDLMLLTEPFFGGSATEPIPLVMPGKILYRIVVHGKSSHALGNPERGINAVDDAARIVTALAGLPLGRDPVLGPMNYCTLKIDGGYREYAVVVPERCEIIVTRLLAPGETREAALGQLDTLIASLGLASRVTVEMAPPSYDPYSMARDHPGVAAFAEAYRARLGVAPSFGGLLGITDANIYQAEGGIPTIIFGPRGAGLHERDEYVDLTTLEPVVDVLVDTALRYFAATAG
ncbi:MAG: M20 family metallopeptidase [Gemmatimonadetes bacterium]|nr:M20 family metallopeptidase [Gemmatimonadota bacterium]